MSSTMTGPIEAPLQDVGVEAKVAAKAPDRTSRVHASIRRGERREYRFVWAIAFLFFLGVVILARFFPRSWRPDPIGTGQYRTVFGEAKAITNMTIPYAFMG
ncbi:MAG: hypothetical protein AAGD23_00175 [Pseudomonadota bacterium]